MHPDAIIAIAASKNSRELTKEIFGDEIGWLPWRRPGFQLGLDSKHSPRPIRMRRASCSKATACSPGPTTPRSATS